MDEIYLRDYRIDGCPSDSSHLIGDDMAALLDAGLPADQLERPRYAVEHGACRVDFRLSLGQTLMLRYDVAAYKELFAHNGLSKAQIKEARTALRALGLTPDTRGVRTPSS